MAGRKTKIEEVEGDQLRDSKALEESEREVDFDAHN